VELLLAAFIGLLPARWRARYEPAWPLGSGARLEGGVQMLAVVPLGAVFYLAHHHAPEGIGSNAEGFVFGAADFLLFFFSFRGALVLWLFLEGGVRYLHSFHDEPLATLPLAVIEAVVQAIKRRPPPPPPPDEVVADGDRLIIRAAQAKNWDELTTVRFGDRLWRLKQIHQAPGSHPHEYELELAPDHHVVRRLVRYGETR
jgi:hypothetical protein